MDDDSELEKAKGTKKCVIKRRLIVESYKDCLFNDKIMLQSQQRFKSDCHNCVLNKSIKMRKVVMMIKDCKYLIKLQRTHTEQMHLKNAKARLEVNIND